MDWKKEIAVAYLVKQEVMKADEECLWPHHLPEVAAVEEEITEVEAVMGEQLEKSYREFLLFSNGWQGFFQAIDLFGTGELLGDSKMKRAEELLLALGNTEDLCGVNSKNLFPIAAARDSVDLVVTERQESNSPGKIYWFAGDLIDTYPNFGEYFFAMVDYNREEVSALKQ